MPLNVSSRGTALTASRVFQVRLELDQAVPRGERLNKHRGRWQNERLALGPRWPDQWDLVHQTREAYVEFLVRTQVIALSMTSARPLTEGERPLSLCWSKRARVG